MTWSEPDLHAWLSKRPRPPRARGSSGHDAAVLARPAGRLVTCADATIEGVHFDAGTSGRLVGRKAAARALSDLAATAATPLDLLLVMSAPSQASARWLRAAITGVDELARQHGAALVGGDLACAPGPAALAVTAIGELRGTRRPVGRDRARAGDLVLVTGPLGGSRARRHLHIQPRLEVGRQLWQLGARAMMDVSDGLGIDLDRLARASGARIELELDAVPVHRDAGRAARASGRSGLAHALSDGEDHELLACLPPAAARRALAASQRFCPSLAAIGRVRAADSGGPGLALLQDGAARPWRLDHDGGGWLHGS